MKEVHAVRVETDDWGAIVTVEYADDTPDKTTRAPPGSEIIVKGTSRDPVSVVVEKPNPTEGVHPSMSDPPTPDAREDE